MRRRIKNTVRIEIDGASLKGATNLEFYIRQRNGIFFSYTPRIVDDNHIEVEIPYKDAMSLKPTEARIQLAFTNSSGNPCATEDLLIFVGDLLKDDGYDH